MDNIEEISNKIDALKRQISILEESLALEKAKCSPLEGKIYSIGSTKIDEILYGGYLEDDIFWSPSVIDWDMCAEIGEYAKKNIRHRNRMHEEYAWPHDNVYDLRNSAENLLKESLDKCMELAVRSGESGIEYDEFTSYSYRIRTGRLCVECRINMPKDYSKYLESHDYELVSFDVTVEMDCVTDF